jgi:hypothetical protein
MKISHKGFHAKAQGISRKGAKQPAADARAQRTTAKDFDMQKCKPMIYCGFASLPQAGLCALA